MAASANTTVLRTEVTESEQTQSMTISSPTPGPGNNATTREYSSVEEAEKTILAANKAFLEARQREVAEAGRREAEGTQGAKKVFQKLKSAVAKVLPGGKGASRRAHKAKEIVTAPSTNLHDEQVQGLFRDVQVQGEVTKGDHVPKKDTDRV